MKTFSWRIPFELLKNPRRAADHIIETSGSNRMDNNEMYMDHRPLELVVLN
ncbi:MAG: hypothetical protein GY859_15710 [Desulfobacterales bacterium]|nr:hypothetical protein [Desulfobacterales bacterium]